VKQIVVISGKGGTGKSTITAALASLVHNKITADCDVDAADLYLIFKPKIKEQYDFSASKTAIIAKEKCTKCGQCLEVCRFTAISPDYQVDPISCEGCGVCFRVCPAGAIEFEPKISGQWFISDSRFGTLAHAKLGIAEENSGKLVAIVRQQAREQAKQQKSDYIIIDGPPGIGCPVIAALTGVDLALVVTEPTLSGIHDLERVLDLADHFKVKALVVINKYDINLDNVRAIEKICKDKKIELIGKIPYDKTVGQALLEEKNIIEYDENSIVAKEIKTIWQKILKQK